MTYDPVPIHTGAVTIPESLAPLVERLAENAHHIWAAGRIKDAWQWGPARDDSKKEHPCLVCFAELPEEEKEYDRASVVGTIKAILALGYHIEKDGEMQK